MAKLYKNQTFENERDLHGARDVIIENCLVDGPSDGESFLKEASNVQVLNSRFHLRYPFWHVNNLNISTSEMNENCRAAIWYSKHIDIRDSKLNGIKALRECEYINLENLSINSPEFAWKSHHITAKNISLTSEYAFLEASDVTIKNLTFEGKYSFQYTKDVEISHSKLVTKDCFWHAKNVTIKDSIIEGEYLAWYSENLTLINCKISGTQPFCYCKNLKLINCTMEGSDLAFEYSEVEADITSSMKSIKNPRSGHISVLKVDEIIITNDSKYPCEAKIVENGKIIS